MVGYQFYTPKFYCILDKIDNYILWLFYFSLQLSLKEKTDHLDKLKEQNQQLEHEVRRFQERERHLEKVQILEKKRPWAVSVEIITFKSN